MRRYIDWKKTGYNLQLLRNDNIDLRRYVCNAINESKPDKEKRLCSGDCESCKFEMDRSISRVELAQVFNVSESVIFNWEIGKTPVSLEDMLFYCAIAKVALDDIIFFEE